MSRGKPTLRPWEEVGLHEMGSEADLQRLAQADAVAAQLAGLTLGRGAAPAHTEPPADAEPPEAATEAAAAGGGAGAPLPAS